MIEEDGRLLAVAGCLAYGPFAWLGLVATHPDARGRGLASQLSQHLVEWAFAQGCATVALDASTDGRPVYERLGFTQVGWTAELLRPAGTPAPRGARPSAAAPADLDELVAFDARCFGGDRAAAPSRARRATRTRVARDPHADGTLGGYLVARGQLIGPAAAVDEASARRARARRARRPGTPQRVLVPPAARTSARCSRSASSSGGGSRTCASASSRSRRAQPALFAQLSYATG